MESTAPAKFHGDKSTHRKQRQSRDWIRFCRALPFRYFNHERIAKHKLRKDHESNTSLENPIKKHKTISNENRKVRVVRPDQCHYILPRKHRRCSLACTPGSKYCGHHEAFNLSNAAVNDSSVLKPNSKALHEQNDSTKRKKQIFKSKGEQISCPQCGDLLRKRKLKKHLKCCNAVKRKNCSEAQSFFQKDLHRGSELLPCKISHRTAEEDINQQSMTSVNSLTTMKETMQKCKKPILPANKHQCDLKAVACVLDSLYVKAQLVGSITPLAEFGEPTEQSMTFLMSMVGSDQSGSADGSVTQKHLRQQAAIICALRKRKLLSKQISRGKGFADDSTKHNKAENPPIRDTDEHSSHSKDYPAIVEFGAARGMMSLDLCKEVPFRTPLVLVEREHGLQNTADRLLRRAGYRFSRLTVDIKDLNLLKVPLLQEETRHISHIPSHDKVASRISKFMSVSKHLCGVATDLMLRCVHHCNVNNLRSGGTIASASGNFKSIDMAHTCIGGAVALCCHHLCVWQDYVGKHFWLNELELSEEDFTRAVQLSHWTSLAEPKADPNSSREDANELQAAIQVVKLKRHIGRRCKRLIDFGRVAFLQSHEVGYNHHGNAALVQYCEESLTPENCLLVFGGAP